MYHDTKNFTIFFDRENISIIVSAVNYLYILHYTIWTGVDTTVIVLRSTDQGSIIDLSAQTLLGMVTFSCDLSNFHGLFVLAR